MIFISYSRRNRRFFTELLTVMAPLTNDVQLRLWDDSLISPGSDWLWEIKGALQTAEAGLLLVSPDFLVAQNFITDCRRMVEITI
jgi:hypothetical protein